MGINQGPIGLQLPLVLQYLPQDLLFVYIQRPSRARFSAVYEDDVDDSMEDDGNRRT